MNVDHLIAYIADAHVGLSAVEAREVRLAMCADDPLFFALTYFPHLLTQADGSISLAEWHVEWCEIASRWVDQAPSRDAFVAPRAAGKTTMWLLILPLWGAAFGHVRFLFWAADAARQAVQHLAALRRELATNELLRFDFPGLCEPELRKGRSVIDREDTFLAGNGFYVTVRGLDSAINGAKDPQGRRPDLILVDDGEPGEGAGYSMGQKDKRLMTLLDDVLPLNTTGRVVLSGTVTMPGSIVHDLVRSMQGGESWVGDMFPRFQVHHDLPFRVHDEVEVSRWPENPRFDMGFMNRNRGSASFAKNYLNAPISGNGTLWTLDSFKDRPVGATSRMLLSVDPAMTSNDRSDFTGIALLSLCPASGQVVVHEAWASKLTPMAMRARVEALVDEFPVTRVLVETNQGGDVIRSLFANLAVPTSFVHQRLSKEARASRVFTQYERGNVVHDKPLPQLQEQMMAFPSGHDDMVDAVTSGVAFFLDQFAKRRRAAQHPVRQYSYI